MLNRWYRRCFVMALVCVVMVVLMCASALAADNIRLGYLVGEDVNVREKASTDSNVIGQKKSEDVVLISGSKGRFFQVIHEDETGYIVDDFVRTLPHDEAHVNAKYVIFREKASTDSNKITTLDIKDIVNVYGETDGFYKVTFKNDIGYISKQYVDIGELKASTIPKQNEQKAEPVEQAKEAIYLEKSGEVSLDFLDMPAEGVKAPEGSLVSRSDDAIELTQDEIMLISKLVQAEGGSSKESSRAIASIVYNRMSSKKFPSSVEGVCYQSGQFSVVNNREAFLARVPTAEQIEAVKEVFLEGKPVLPEDIMFFKSSRLNRYWGEYRSYYSSIGGNMFYS